MKPFQLEGVDPSQVYSFSEACRFLPGSAGGRLHVNTLHRWRMKGILIAICRRAPDKSSVRWFVYGAELIRLFVQTGDADELVRTADEQQQADEKARRELERRHGKRVVSPQARRKRAEPTMPRLGLVPDEEG